MDQNAAPANGGTNVTPPPPVALTTQPLTWEGTLGQFMSSPIVAKLDATTGLHVQINPPAQKEAGTVRTRTAVILAIGGIALGVGGTFAVQALFGGSDESKPAAKK